MLSIFFSLWFRFEQRLIRIENIPFNWVPYVAVDAAARAKSRIIFRRNEIDKMCEQKILMICISY